MQQSVPRIPLIVGSIVLSGFVTAAEVSHPPGPVVESFTIKPERRSIGDGDNWPITWGKDGDQYTGYCDGNGFGGGSGKGSMCLAIITGSPRDFAGENVLSPSGRKEGGGRSGRKASGLVMVDGVLYMWIRNLKADGTGSSLAWSSDKARTWTWEAWSFPRIGYPVWLNAGQNYSAAQDEYVYFYSPDTPSAYAACDHMLLGRVHKTRVTRKEAYEFYAGQKNTSTPRWTSP